MGVILFAIFIEKVYSLQDGRPVPVPVLHTYPRLDNPMGYSVIDTDRELNKNVEIWKEMTFNNKIGMHFKFVAASSLFHFSA